MPKYIKTHRKGPKPKPHKVIHGIEHKQCSGICKKWKPLDQFAKCRNRKHYYCKPCVKKYDKQRRKALKEKRKKVREAAQIDSLVCLNAGCTVKGLQSLDQFISDFVRNDKPTSYCLTCRNKSKEDREQRYAACQKVWDDWRKTHPCVKCMNDPNYKHNPLLIEADHLPEFEKVTHCSNMSYWSHSKRGPAAQKAELKKCQATCRFHHTLQTQQRDHENGRIRKEPCKVRKRVIINAEKYKRGCCLRCERVVKEGEECAFEFDHRDPNTKFKYNGKSKGPSDFVYLPQALFDKQWPIEKELVDLLCANCHKLKTFANRDAYKK